MRIAVAATRDGRAEFVDPDGAVRLEVERAMLPAEVARLESEFQPRWVWRETREWAPGLLHAGVRIARCHDLRLCGAILASSARVSPTERSAAARPAWLAPGPAEAAGVPGDVPPAPSVDRGPALFDLESGEEDASAATGSPTARDLLDEHDRQLALVEDSERPGALRLLVAAESAGALIAAELQAAGLPWSRDLLDEHDRQLALVEASERPGALRLLLAAESAGALIAAELQAAGLPWSREVHERVLEEMLGARPAPGRKPVHMEDLAGEVRAALEAPILNLDSQVDLLRALRSAGIGVDSTARWELRDHDHPAIAPLIAYKRLARLLSANGWSWLDEWVVGGRFRADWVAGGTATGRWATAGGGALQLPKAIRRAVQADDGWMLVVADASQLEPRVLAALARDPAMAAAGRGRDMYRAIVEAGVVATRDEAKVALLGAMYGATTGDSGRLVPRLARAYPRAMALVDQAAREGEAGRTVTTLLGRSAPLPPARWHELQARATQPDATETDERRARTAAREWGRFTRNFVVQGTAAEWALCWLAGVRNRLIELGGRPDSPTARGAPAATASGRAFARVPHLVYFLHDELIVHAPAELADRVADAVRDAAAEAGRLLFGEAPVEFPLNLATVRSYGSTD